MCNNSYYYVQNRQKYNAIETLLAFNVCNYVTTLISLLFPIRAWTRVENLSKNFRKKPSVTPTATANKWSLQKNILQKRNIWLLKTQCT